MGQKGCFVKKGPFRALFFQESVVYIFQYATHVIRKEIKGLIMIPHAKES